MKILSIAKGLKEAIQTLNRWILYNVIQATEEVYTGFDRKTKRKGNLSLLGHGYNHRIKILFKSQQRKGLTKRRTWSKKGNCQGETTPAVAMKKCQFSATERVKFKAEGMRKESGEAGRKESNLCWPDMLH